MGRAKEKRKKKRQRNWYGTFTSGRELWRRKSFHTLWSPLTGRDRGELQSLRGECSNRGVEGKMERIPPRGSVPTSTLQPEMLACPPAWWGLGAEVQTSEVRHLGEDWGWLQEDSLRSYCATDAGDQEETWAYQRGKGPLLWGAQKEGQACHRIFFLCALTDSRAPPTQVPGAGVSLGSYLGPQRWVQWLLLPPLPPRFLWASTGHCPHLPGSLCSWPLPRVQQSRATSPGKGSAWLRLLQLPAGLCYHRHCTHSTHIPIVTAVSLTVPGLSEQVSPNQPLLSPTLAWAGSRCLRVAHMQRWCQNQSWTPGAVKPKKRKWNCSMQLQEQWIKSLQLAWKTLHLWNIWIDKECSHNWGCRLWRQLRTLGASIHRSWARSDSELALQCTQQVQRPT